MAQSPLAPPPPTGGPIDGWLYLLWRRLTATGQVLWSSLSFSGSNLTDIETRNHADLQNLNTASYTHLTATNHTDLTDAGDSALHYHSTDRNSANFTGTNWTDLTDAGDSTLHYHASDRARANHSGTQTLATISDAGTMAAQAANNVAITGGAISGTTLTMIGYTVAGLPAAGTVGRIAYVTDALAPAFLVAVAGGGAVKTPVFDDGTNWVAF